MSLIQNLEVNRLASVFPGIGDTEYLRSRHSLADWNMERDDAPILGQIIRWMCPRRHLEFGTWKGFGACLVLENSPATVWTLNLWQGEFYPTGVPAYSENQSVKKPHSLLELLVRKRKTQLVKNVQTDARGNIGILIQQKKLGHRVNHIFCDSREWDTSTYPQDFFDTIFIDGGHQSEVVASDTRKALPLLRPGGVVLWHDFCMEAGVRKKYPHVASVIRGVESVARDLTQQGINLYWIYPSWLLCGVKGHAPVPTAKS